METPYPENNRSPRRSGFRPSTSPANGEVAALVLPHWNASATSTTRCARAWPSWGSPRCALSLPYHDYRMPAELKRADYAVSANVARTIDATRQAVIDTRSCVDWLEAQGYESIGICRHQPGFLLRVSGQRPRSAHLKVNVFNHCSTYFADVVWEGLVDAAYPAEPGIGGDARAVAGGWMAISPPHYIERYATLGKKIAVHLRAVRHHVPHAFLRAGDRKGARTRPGSQSRW